MFAEYTQDLSVYVYYPGADEDQIAQFASIFPDVIFFEIDSPL